MLLPIALMLVGSWADSFSTSADAAERHMHMIGSADVARWSAPWPALSRWGQCAASVAKPF